MLGHPDTKGTAMELSNEQAELGYLAERWLEAKVAETKANIWRLDVESRILKISPAREEGSTTIVLSTGHKLKTTGKLSYKADLDALLTITAAWPTEYRPVKTEIKADETVLKHIRATRPDLWREIAPAITTKPAKTAITVEQETE
jgi:hypothetical protein